MISSNRSAAAEQAVNAARLLLKLTENYADADPIARELNEVEHACDDVAHRPWNN